MDILVISGFLGAGKTTFIKEIIKKTKRDYCILENEYGAINIDSSTLKEGNTSDDMKIYEFTEGCICCSSKGEFASSVLTISNTLDPDYLIVEPTGVGYLSAILNNLNKVKYERINILKPITIVDGVFLYNNLNSFKLDECLLDQIKYASIIVVSKNENLSENDKNLIKDKIKAINEDATLIIDKHYSLLDESFYKGILTDKDKISSEEIKSKVNPLPLTNFSLKDAIKIDSEYELISILEDVSRGEYGLVNRAKGFINISKRTYHFEYVNGIYSLTEYLKKEGETIDSEVVFIGYQIDKTGLRSRLIKVES